ncbi:LytTR family transcriptional regulator DNA-binding domain-containing protein [Ornithinibacillus halotolerans]|uniref:Transcriptional regulator n=1 Tax=Ornithinibacillus halotolerans TaxID=1274357 RepID=A0A916W8T3_9BACI|nr:LytTR family transcriptional regulator DNA-binding domain-containing protein [Ornithinibacillus halotolerans]GGA77650.1 transcriptional regulator [Ornithinibacillus halotolerans]
MEVLSIQNLERQEKDALLFPAFDLKVYSGEIIAIHSNLNIRMALLQMFLGKAPLGKGEILVKGEKLDKNSHFSSFHIGISFFEQAVYHRLSVKDNLKFFSQVYSSSQSIEEVLNLTQLNPYKNSPVQKLSFSEKRRVHFAKILIENPILYIFEEPDLNVDLETKRVFLNVLEYLAEQGKAVLILTGNMESAITMSKSVYRLNDEGIHLVEIKDESASTVEEEETVPEDEKTTMTVNINKIPTKVNDKIILFDPPEIDYIESNDGQSNVFIKGEAFPSTFTMNELEERLMPFGFFRCHRSYIVNLQKVREVITWTRNSFSLVLDDAKKSTIPLSKTKMAQLKEMLGLK